MKLRKTAAAFLAALVVPAAGLAAETMRAGLWEMTTTMEIPGIPMQMPATTMQHCFTGEDVADQKKIIAANKDCAVTEMNRTGNKVAWKMQCTGQSAGDFDGVTVFTGDSYQSTMHMQAQGEAMTMNVKARRLGDCQ